VKDEPREAVVKAGSHGTLLSVEAAEKGVTESRG
jgi:hypothetical protein